MPRIRISTVRGISAVWLIVLILLPFSEPFSTCAPGDLFAIHGAGAHIAGLARAFDSAPRFHPVSCAVAPARVGPEVLSRALTPRFLPVPRAVAPAGAPAPPAILHAERASSSVLRI